MGYELAALVRVQVVAVHGGVARQHALQRLGGLHDGEEVHHHVWCEFVPSASAILHCQSAVSPFLHKELRGDYFVHFLNGICMILSDTVMVLFLTL